MILIYSIYVANFKKYTMQLLSLMYPVFQLLFCWCNKCLKCRHINIYPLSNRGQFSQCQKIITTGLKRYDKYSAAFVFIMSIYVNVLGEIHVYYYYCCAVKIR
jgi:hypothetical protein